MSSNRFRDFDLWEAERVQEPVRFKVRGVEFELPATLPAIIPVRVLRLQRAYGGESEIPKAELIELGLSIFGKGQLDKLLDTGVDTDLLGEIITWAIEVYTGEPRGNLTTPETAPGLPDS